MPSPQPSQAQPEPQTTGPAFPSVADLDAATAATAAVLANPAATTADKLAVTEAEMTAFTAFWWTPGGPEIREAGICWPPASGAARTSSSSTPAARAGTRGPHDARTGVPAALRPVLCPHLEGQPPMTTMHDRGIAAELASTAADIAADIRLIGRACPASLEHARDLLDILDPPLDSGHPVPFTLPPRGRGPAAPPPPDDGPRALPLPAPAQANSAR